MTQISGAGDDGSEEKTQRLVFSPTTSIQTLSLNVYFLFTALLTGFLFLAKTWWVMLVP